MDPFEFADLFVGVMRSESETGSNSEPQSIGSVQKVSGVATTDSESGYAYVDLGGSSVTQDDAQAVEMPTDISVKAGDEVAVEIVDGKPRVTGRIGWGDELQSVADEAHEVAAATNQHFWHRSTDPDGDGAGTGAFVTDEEQESFLEAISQGVQPTSQRPLYNLLMNSLGILLRTATRIRAAFVQNGVNFYDDNELPMAQFGRRLTGIFNFTEYYSAWMRLTSSNSLQEFTIDSGGPTALGDIEPITVTANDSLKIDAPEISIENSGSYVATIDGGGNASFSGSLSADDFNGFRGRRNLSATDSIDALYTTGIYYIGSGGVQGTLPSGITAYFSLVAMGGGAEDSGTYVGKQMILGGSGVVWTRSYSGSPRAWSAWVQLVSDSVAVHAPSITNATATKFETRRQGKTVNLSIYQLKLSAALANSSSVSLGTGIIGANARPTNVVYLPLTADAAGFGAGVLMSIGTGGNVTVYNRSGASLGTGVSLNGNTTWVI